jgi:hypothetical protein
LNFELEKTVRANPHYAVVFTDSGDSSPARDANCVNRPHDMGGGDAKARMLRSSPQRTLSNPADLALRVSTILRFYPATTAAHPCLGKTSRNLFAHARSTGVNNTRIAN